MSMNLSRRNFIAATVASTVVAGRARPLGAPLKTGPLGKYVWELAPGRYGADTLDDYYRRGLQRYLFGGDNTKRKVPTPDGRNGNPGKKH